MSLGGAVSAVRTMREFGIQDMEFEKESQKIFEGLREAHLILPRESAPFIKKAEVLELFDRIDALILELKKIESKSNRKAALAGIKLTENGVEAIAGPVAGVVAKVFTHSPKQSLSLADEGLEILPNTASVIETVEKTSKSELKKEGLKAVKTLAIESLTLVGVDSANSVVTGAMGVVAVGNAIVAPKKAIKYVTETFQGTKGLSQKIASRVFKSLSKREQVIQSYTEFFQAKEVLEDKKEKLKKAQESLKLKNEEIIQLNKKITELTDSCFRITPLFIQAKEETLKAKKIFDNSSEENNLANKQLSEQKNLKELTAVRLKKQKTNFCGRILNSKNPLLRFIAFLFSSIICSLKKQKRLQKQLENKMLTVDREILIKQKRATKKNEKKEAAFNKYQTKKRLFKDLQIELQNEKDKLNKKINKLVVCNERIEEIKGDIENRSSQIAENKNLIRATFEKYSMLVLSS